MARSSIYAASNVVATSVVKGQSISDSISDNGGAKQIILTSLANSLAEVGAKEIGTAAHGTTTTLTDSSGNPLRNLDGSVMTSSQISQPTQLALHGVLGATTSTLMGGDALSGAAAGIAGEFAADSAYKEGSGSFGRQGAIAIGQAVGAAAALATSSAQGKSDEKTATNVGIGGFIGMNAAANNSTYFLDKKISNYPKNKDYNINAGITGDLVFTSVNMGTDGSSKDFSVIPSIGGGIYFNLVPRGEEVSGSLSYGPRPFASGEVIKTSQGNTGFGVTFGAFVTPPIPVNITVTPTTKK